MWRRSRRTPLPSHELLKAVSYRVWCLQVPGVRSTVFWYGKSFFIKKKEILHNLALYREFSAEMMSLDCPNSQQGYKEVSKQYCKCVSTDASPTEALWAASEMTQSAGTQTVCLSLGCPSLWKLLPHTNASTGVIAVPVHICPGGSPACKTSASSKWVVSYVVRCKCSVTSSSCHLRYNLGFSHVWEPHYKLLPYPVKQEISISHNLCAPLPLGPTAVSVVQKASQVGCQGNLRQEEGWTSSFAGLHVCGEGEDVGRHREPKYFSGSLHLPQLAKMQCEPEACTWKPSLLFEGSKAFWLSKQSCICNLWSFFSILCFS